MVDVACSINFALNVEDKNATGQVKLRVIDGYSLNVPVEESVLEKVPAAAIEELTGPNSILAVDKNLKLRDVITNTLPHPVDLFPWLLIGVLMLTQGAGFQASTRGLVAITVACVTWSIGSVLSQFRLPLAPGATGFASEMLCGGAVLLGLSWVSGEAPQWPPQPVAVAAWAYLVVFGSLIAFNAYMVLLARAPSGLASSYTFTQSEQKSGAMEGKPPRRVIVVPDKIVNVVV